MNINQNLSIDYIQSRVAFLRKLHPGRSVICAGGAIRDLLNKKKVKDLDFFIQGYAKDFFECAYGPMRKEFTVDEFPYSQPKSDRPTTKEERDNHNRSFMEILTALGGGYGGPSYSDFYTVEFSCGWRGYPVQLVYLKDTDDIRAECMENFDFGVTRCWADDKRLRLTHDFHEDANNRRLTFYGSGWGETSEERLKRIREKYADWKFRDLSHLRAPPKPKAEGMTEPVSIEEVLNVGDRIIVTRDAEVLKRYALPATFAGTAGTIIRLGSTGDGKPFAAVVLDFHPSYNGGLYFDAMTKDETITLED